MNRHDPLTDLANRALFQERLDQCLAGLAQGRTADVSCRVLAIRRRVLAVASVAAAAQTPPLITRWENFTTATGMPAAIPALRSDSTMAGRFLKPM